MFSTVAQCQMLATMNVPILAREWVYPVVLNLQLYASYRLNARQLIAVCLLRVRDSAAKSAPPVSLGHPNWVSN